MNHWEWETSKNAQFTFSSPNLYIHRRNKNSSNIKKINNNKKLKQIN